MASKRRNMFHKNKTQETTEKGRFYSLEMGCEFTGCRQCKPQFDSEADEQERTSEYNEGGYLALEIGRILDNRYQVVRKLGWGVFSTVWMCWDMETGEFVALKIVKDLECDRVIALGEVAMLRSIQERGTEEDVGKSTIVSLRNSFSLPGENGVHVCMVFDVLGKNLLSLVDYEGNKGIHLKNVKSIIKQVLEALSFLHEKCHVVHTDLKPENVFLCVDSDYVRKLALDVVERVWSGQPLATSMVCAGSRRVDSGLRCRLRLLKKVVEGGWSGGDRGGWGRSLEWARLRDSVARGPRSLRVKLGDFGNAVPVGYDYKCTIQTEPYRAPEVILGAGFGCSADIWSVACLAFELATGTVLFEPTKSQSATRPENHLACIMQVCGPVPYGLRLRGRHTFRYFTKFGTLKHLGKVKKIGLKQILVNECGFRKKSAGEFSDFLQAMLNVDPAKRPTATQCLRHPWLAGQRYNYRATPLDEE
ncbi:hypothetical protein AAG570_010475 [Ranatra chinensis]|uniref:non-specific serine/threonine protein kinase n=1 Tax=Ranatra chinensis TaxID=642074 RepID=A0ABD0YMX0_9HEMI